MFLVGFLLVFLGSLASAVEYEHRQSLDVHDRFVLSWTITDDIIRLSLDAETTGWVGFGFGAGMLNVSGLKKNSKKRETHAVFFFFFFFFFFF
jgi:hypothetical protein